MRRIAFQIASLCCVFLSSIWNQTLSTLTGVASAGQINLVWACPTNALDTNLIFSILDSTNIALPPDQWPILTNVSGTNFSALLTVEPGQHFLMLAVSNLLNPASPTLTAAQPAATPITLAIASASVSASGTSTNIASANPSTANSPAPSPALYCLYAQTWHQTTNAGLAMVTSTNLGANWSAPFVVVDQSDGWSANHAFGVTSSGRLVCIYATAKVPYVGYPSNPWTNITAIYSDDQGRTWNHGLIPNNRIWSITNEWNYTGRTNQMICPIPYGQIRQAAGTLFCGAYQAWTLDSSASYVLISNDNGFSWKPHLINYTNFTVINGTNRPTADEEPEILPVTDSVLLAGIRHGSTDSNPTILSLAGSTDGGSTWTNRGWIPTAVASSAQNPVGLNLFQAPDGPHVFMAYGDRAAGKLYLSQAPLGETWTNPAVLYSNRIPVAAISGSLNADGGYATAVPLDNNGNFLVGYYYAPFTGGYAPAQMTNATIRFIQCQARSSGISVNFGNTATNLPNQYPYEAFPVLAIYSTNLIQSAGSTNTTQ